MAIGGLDIGTTGAKISVYDREGMLLHADYLDYPVSRNTAAHEVHGDDIWAVAKQLIRGVAAAVPGLAAIGITGFGESFMLLGHDGGVLLPTMLYTDPRGSVEAEELRQKLGDDRICAIAGCAPHSMYSLPKLMWVKKHRPEAFAAAKHVCLIGDFLAYRLTGRRIIDYSLAARTMALDIRKKVWSSEICEAAGIDPALFSEPVPTGTEAGPVLPGIALELGVREDLRVVVCCHDQVAAAVGSNVLRPGQATDGAGTVQCITPVFSPIPDGRSLQDNNYAIVPFLRKDTYCLYAFSYTGGALVKWYVDTLAGNERAAARERGISIHAQLESGAAADEPTGILVLPHFAGAATPYMDNGSKGAIVGLTLTHTGSDLYRACLEGVVYEMALNLERLNDAGIRPDMLRATGGGARSAMWLQMKADILNIPVQPMAVEEAGTIGGIMLTGVATGVYPSLEKAAEVLVRPAGEFRPRPLVHQKYMEVYARYRCLYGAVRPLV